MNRKSFLSTLLMAIAAPFLPSPQPDNELCAWQKRALGLIPKHRQMLIGEGTGTARSNPEVIAPLDQLKRILNKRSPLDVEVRGRLGGRSQIIFRSNKNPVNKLRYREYNIKKEKKN